MTLDAQEFSKLMERVGNGSTLAEATLHELFRDYLHLFIRKQFPDQLRNVMDSTDITQEVWSIFFAKYNVKGRFSHPNEFRAFLATVARNFLRNVIRDRLNTRKRHSPNPIPFHNPDTGKSLDVANNDPTPSQTVMCEEEWQNFLNRQPKIYRKIFTKRLEGKTQLEISQELGIHERTIQRVLHTLKTYF